MIETAVTTTSNTSTVAQYSKAIAAFIGSVVGLAALFGLHTGLLSDVNTQNIIAGFLATIIPTVLVYFAPHNVAAPSTTTTTSAK